MAQKSQIRLLLRILDQAYEKKAWHGPNLRGAVRGLTAAQAAWRPSRHRHNIQEIVVHAAYWKYAVRRRLLGGKKGSFPLKGSNWFPRRQGEAERLWKADCALLDSEHGKMRKAIAALNDGDLEKTPPRSRVSNAMLIYGIASHDLYHAGQIQLLKKLRRK
jgi:uncharacterized damage-inducible protein DinB